ncbi:MAG TPA: AMP-binding protein [Aliidongia sp.]|nr:AMP-binding protein [Aliidongia sp.]
MTTSDPAAAFLAARDFLLRHREDYDTAYRDFRWPVLDRFNWALDYFDRLAAGNDRPALWLVHEEAPDEILSFAEMKRRSNQVARYLQGLGVRRGDRVLLMLGNVRPLWEAMLAIMKLGAVIVPATTLLSRADLGDRFARGRIRHVVTSREHAGRFGSLDGDYTKIAVGGAEGWQRYEDAYALPPDFTPQGETRAQDPMLLYFTSGTTARPKLVLHSHQSYPVGHLSTLYWLGMRPGDIHLNISSPGWAKHAWSSFFAPWNGEATILVTNQARFNAKTLLDTIRRCGVTTFCAPPTVWRMLVQQDLHAWQTSLTELAAAGEPLNPEIIEHVRHAWGLTIRDGYGQTETSAQIGNSPGQPLKVGSMGRPLPGYAVRLLDAGGEEAGEGEISLALRPARPLGLMMGYQADDGGIGALQGEAYRTGDVAMRDADGYLTYVGRVDDVFKASDYRISPFELESVLIEHEAVIEAAIVPSPDPVRLAVPKAFIVLTDGQVPDRVTALAIFRHLRQRLAPFKRVRRLEFSELPKTISGKIRRVELRTVEAQRRAAGTREILEFWEEDFPELGL